MLAGRTVLVVEDEYLIALFLMEILQEGQATAIGPVAELDAAVRLVRSSPVLDGALLNVNLRGAMAFPVADALIGRGVRFAFVTSYERDLIPARYGRIPCFGKDPTLADIAGALLP